jgi:hypothetical protein
MEIIDVDRYHIKSHWKRIAGLIIITLGIFIQLVPTCKMATHH